MAFKSTCLICLGILLVAAANAGETPFSRISSTQLPVSVTYMGDIANLQINEASGLAASRFSPDVLWTVNDGGDGPLLYAVGITGADLGSIRIAGAKNRDWEDLASFRLNETAYLLVADTGNNKKKRQFGYVYVLEEPHIPAKPSAEGESVNLAWGLRFKYEDGPQDCEAAAVDVKNRRILLLSKQAGPTVLYELPLHPRDKTATITARRSATVPEILTPTAMDIAPDGLSAAILTYTRAYLFLRKDGEDWSEALLRSPKYLSFSALTQQEAICFSFDAKALFVTSEQRPAPLIRIGLNMRDSHK